MKKEKIDKGLEKKLRKLDTDLLQIRQKKVQLEILCNRISDQIISDFKNKSLKNLKISDSLKNESKIKHRTDKLIGNLNSKKLGLTILAAINLLKQFDEYSSRKISPSEFKRDIDSIEKSFKSVQKQLKSFYVKEFIISYQGELETIELESSIQRTLTIIAKNKKSAAVFQSRYDNFFNNDYFKANKSKTEERKKLTILCSCLNQLCEETEKNLTINFLSTLSEALIIAINAEAKVLNFKKINLGEKIPHYDIVNELVRSATWESLAKN